MKHLHTLYPETRITRKREELDRLATSYVQALYGYLPCLDLAEETNTSLAEDILHIASQISQVQRHIEGETPLQGNIGQTGQIVAPTFLTLEQQAKLKQMIRDLGIYAGKEDDSDIIYVSHPLIEGRAHALNEAELYEIVCDIAERSQNQ